MIFDVKFFSYFNLLDTFVYLSFNSVWLIRWRKLGCVKLRIAYDKEKKKKKLDSFIVLCAQISDHVDANLIKACQAGLANDARSKNVFNANSSSWIVSVE